MAIEASRAQYRLIRSLTPVPAAEFDARCVARLGADGKGTAAEWIAAAEVVAAEVVVPCARCAGTGRFITYVENGIPKGPGGPCYRCEGKGKQTSADRMRNHWYDRAAFGRAARAMVGG